MKPVSVFTRRGARKRKRRQQHVPRLDERSIIDDLQALAPDETRPMPSQGASPRVQTLGPDALPEKTPFFDAHYRPVLPCSHCTSVHADGDAGAYAHLFARLRATAVQAGWRRDVCGCCWSCPECRWNGSWTPRFLPAPKDAEAEWRLIEHTRTVALNPDLALALRGEWPWETGRHARVRAGVSS